MSKPSSSKNLNEENLNLFLQFKKTGNEEFFKQIIVNLTGFVNKVCSDLYFAKTAKLRSKISLSEVCQEGFLGAIYGLKKFEPERGYAVTTYLYYWIWEYANSFIKRNFEFKIATSNEKRKAIVSLYRDGKNFSKDDSIDIEALSKFCGINKNILEEVQAALSTKFVDFSIENEDQIISDAFFDRGPERPDILLEKKQKLHLLQKVKQIYLSQISEKIKPEFRGVYKDLLNKHVLPDPDSEFWGCPQTLDQVAKNNGYPDKRYVDPFKKKLIDSLSQIYLEFYKYHTISGKKVEPSLSARARRD